MPISYYRWIKKTSPDIASAEQKIKPQIRSHYLQAGVLRESTSAVWLFRLDRAYRPGGNLSADRQLFRVEFTADGEAIMESAENHIDFEDASFQGEAAHSLKIIIKANEPGARGVGIRILEFLNARIKTIAAASPAEVRKATM